ncbi:MAG: phosphotransferase [Proteobacteria bacterium]|nr:phosphotransferase [Pseudomonadota bacterium]
MNSDPRKAEMMLWLATIDAVAGLGPVAASADASFRRYFRLQAGQQSFIVMDAPPPKEDCLPFVRIAGYLEAMQLVAPRILAANIERGFLLLSDLGSQAYLMSLTEDPSSAAGLYADAMRAIVSMQVNGSAYQALLPPYDEKLLRIELSLFHDWLCETHIGLQFSAADEARWQALCDLLVANALEQPQVFVHRDYHSRNLMHLTDNNPGLLDFQDAVEGPYTYDLVSLLKDCYVLWPAEQVRRWALDYHAMLENVHGAIADRATFLRQFEFMGVQRHLKAAGILARLNHRDGKPGYMADIPRTLQYIVELGPRHAELNFIAGLINDKCLPALAPPT